MVKKFIIGKINIKMYMDIFKDLNILIIIITFILPFSVLFFEILFWNSITQGEINLSNVESNKLVAYILLSNVLKEQFNVYTPATTALWEGSIIKYYTRPLNLIPQFIYEMIGKNWLPKWITFSIPSIIIIYLFGFDIFPYSLKHFVFFIISLIFAIVIGFEVDILFASIAIKLKNGCWAAEQIRNIIIVVLSGQLIPLQFFPKNFADFFMLLPFSSMASAPLTIYIGGAYINRILLQVFWAIVLGFFAYYIFRKSEEGMVSFGG